MSVPRENKPITQNQRAKLEACNLSKVSKFRQLIFGLLTETLQCSAKAKQALVDNHLLCGGRQGEMEQMAIVLFCCGCFLWIRNALLNAKLCGRGEANECPAPCSLSGATTIVVCVLRFQSDGRALLIHECTELRGWTRHTGISLPHTPCPSPSKSLSNSPSHGHAHTDEKRFCCSRK